MGVFPKNALIVAFALAANVARAAGDEFAPMALNSFTVLPKGFPSARVMGPNGALLGNVVPLSPTPLQAESSAGEQRSFPFPATRPFPRARSYYPPYVALAAPAAVQYPPAVTPAKVVKPLT
jgi:hypothetical protein